MNIRHNSVGRIPACATLNINDDIQRRKLSISSSSNQNIPSNLKKYVKTSASLERHQVPHASTSKAAVKRHLSLTKNLLKKDLRRDSSVDKKPS